MNYRIGQKFEIEGCGQYILAEATPTTVMLVHLTHGNKWCARRKVKDIFNISEHEFEDAFFKPRWVNFKWKVLTT